MRIFLCTVFPIMTKENNIYQLIQPESPHKNVVSINSVKDVPKLAEHIVHEMTRFSWEATDAIESFLRAFFTDVGPAGAVIVKRIKNDKSIILDIHVLWKESTFATEQETTEQTQKLTALHQILRDKLFLPIDSVLYFIAPTRYKTVEQLQSAIPTKLPDNQKLQVIGSITK